MTTTQKPAAREHITSFLSKAPPQNISEIAVRINAVSTPHALADLTSVLKTPHLDALVVPKVNRASDLHFVTDVLRHVAPERHASSATETGTQGQGAGGRGKAPVKIIALIESAEAVMNLNEICKASSYLDGLIFAAEDFALDLSLSTLR